MWFCSAVSSSVSVHVSASDYLFIGPLPFLYKVFKSLFSYCRSSLFSNQIVSPNNKGSPTLDISNQIRQFEYKGILLFCLGYQTCKRWSQVSWQKVIVNFFIKSEFRINWWKWNFVFIKSNLNKFKQNLNNLGIYVEQSNESVKSVPVTYELNRSQTCN